MFRIALSLIVAVLAVSCGGPRYVDYFPCHDDGKLKPSVVVVPVMVPCEMPCASDVSKAMTGNIRFQFMNEGELFLLSEGEVHKGLSEIGNIEWLTNNEAFAQHFCNADFIVLTELMQSPVLPSCNNGPCPCQYNFIAKLRIKVIDVRPRCPRIVLQEILKGDYIIPCTADEVASGALNCNPETYRTSPMGKVHQRLISAYVQRIQEVIKSAY
jgi:hypothetical protein